MSIIYEALKKVESSPSKLPDASSSLLQQSKKINFPFYALIGACVIFTVFIALSAYFSNRNLQSEAVKNYLAKKEIEKTKNEISLPLMTSIAQAKAGANTLSSVNPVADNPSPNKPDYPVYSLQGIVYDESSPSAIINGKTLRKSEAIDDFIVTDIAPTTVTLKNSKTDKELALSF